MKRFRKKVPLAHDLRTQIRPVSNGFEGLRELFDGESAFQDLIWRSSSGDERSSRPMHQRRATVIGFMFAVGHVLTNDAHEPLPEWHLSLDSPLGFGFSTIQLPDGLAWVPFQEFSGMYRDKEITADDLRRFAEFLNSEADGLDENGGAGVSTEDLRE